MQTAWDVDVTRPQYPHLPGHTSCDLVVVGLGASGLTAVLAAAEAGLRVIGIDAGPIAAGAGGRNGGFLLAGIARFHHDAGDRHGHEKAARIYRHTLTEMDRTEALCGDAIRREGVLRAAVNDEEFADCERHCAALVADGFAGRMYEGPEGRGLLVESDGVFHPVIRAMRVAQAAERAGATLYTNTKVLGVAPNLVRTEHGNIEAGHVLVAVDGRLEVLLPQLSSEVRTTRLQMAGTGPDPKRTGLPVYSKFGYDYYQQLPDGRFAFGGGRDLYKDDEWTTDDTPTEQVQAYIEMRIRELGITAPITQRWGANVSYTDTGLPMAREIEPSIWALGAYSGTGNVVGTLLGRAIVDQIVNGESQVLVDFAK